MSTAAEQRSNACRKMTRCSPPLICSKLCRLGEQHCARAHAPAYITLTVKAHNDYIETISTSKTHPIEVESLQLCQFSALATLLYEAIQPSIRKSSMPFCH